MVKQEILKKCWLVLFAVLFLLNGCGGGGSSSDGDTSGAGTAGVAVDPYITGAVFEEVSSGGEVLQTSTASNSNGRFNFKQTVQKNSVIRMKENKKGSHIGKPYGGDLRGAIDAAGELVVSPLTTLLGNGFTAEQVITMLDDAGISTLQESDLYNDPMAGLSGMETVSDDDLTLLQASVAVNAFLLRLDNFAWGPGSEGDMEHLAEAVEMVKFCLNQTRYQEVRNQLSDTLADFGSPVTIDHLISSTSNLVETLAVAARNGEISDPVSEIEQLDNTLTELTLHYYVKENSGDAAIEEAIGYEILPNIGETQYPQVDLGGGITIYNVDGLTGTADSDSASDTAVDAGTGSDPVVDPGPVEDPVTDPDPVVPSSPPADGSLKVFPGAEGYGVDTPAGRGGKIIHVTNLNDSGTGSFRAAVTASGPRIVVFDISGTIELQSDIKITQPYITIAGQTAPSPGIQLRNQTVKVSTHDVLMQHMALRPGDTFVSGSIGEVHALVVSSSAYNCVFDHLSLYWGIDECVGVYGDNLTFSNNIIAEGLDDAGHPDGSHSCGMLIMAGADKVAVVRNLYANQNHRSPWIKENTTVYHANNYAYNSRGTFFNFTTDRAPYTGSLISVSNIYGKGPSSDTTKGLSVSSNFTSAEVYEADSRGDSASPYGVLSTLVKLASEYAVDDYPFEPPTYTRLASSAVKSNIVANAGSRPAMRDSADARVINQLVNFTGSLIDSPSQVGGWPQYSVTKKVFNEGTNPHGDNDGDGYTNIEELLHQMSADVEG